mgnify:CR=1 FL=1
MEATYKKLCDTASDINEHLPTLRKYAEECETIFETGVRGVVSSWAFADGLRTNGKDIKSLYVNDISPCAINDLSRECEASGITLQSEWKNNLELDMNGKEFDMTFIDTWHVYGQLKRELEKFAPVTKKYIVMHDTTVDEVHGETMRCMGGRPTAERQSKETGIPVEEIVRGLWPAVTEFLEAHDDWELRERFTNNNGLTILKKIDC